MDATQYTEIASMISIVWALKNLPKVNVLWNLVPKRFRVLIPLSVVALYLGEQAIASGLAWRDVPQYVLMGFSGIGIANLGRLVKSPGSNGSNGSDDGDTERPDPPDRTDPGVGNWTVRLATIVFVCLVFIGCGARPLTIADIAQCDGVTAADIEINYDAQLLKLKSSGKCNDYTADTCPALQELRAENERLLTTWEACDVEGT